MIPAMESGRFKGKVGFGIAPSHLDLPTARVGTNEKKGLLNRDNGLVGEQIPGLASLVLTGNDQPQRGVGKVGMSDLDKIDADGAFTIATGIPEFALAKRAFAATDSPGFVRDPLGVNQLVVFLPTQHKPQAQA